MDYIDEVREFISNKEIFNVSQLDKLYQNLKNIKFESTILGTSRKYYELVLNMVYDYNHKFYRDIDDKNIAILVLSVLYFILPNELLEPIIGKRSFFKTTVALGFSFKSIYSELKKYELFLNDNEVTYTTELGRVCFYKHRMDVEDENEDN